MSTHVINIRHSSADSGYIYIGRSPGKRTHMINTPIGQAGWLGNPHSKHEREINIAMFKNDFLKRIESDAEFRTAVLNLRGATLGCFCKPKSCHGDIIAAWIDSQTIPEVS